MVSSPGAVPVVDLAVQHRALGDYDRAFGLTDAEPQAVAS
jgi:hypothetical protein